MASKVKYFVDVKELARKAYKDPQFIRSARYLAGTEKFKLFFGQLVIDEIFRRTQRSLDKNDEPFEGYAPSYKKSLPYRAYGKTGKVNMTLSGEMLSSMKVVPVTNGINIEMISQINNDKAHGHINGTISKKGNRHLPVRDFLGLTEDREVKLFKRAIRDLSAADVLQELSTKFATKVQESAIMEGFFT